MIRKAREEDLPAIARLSASIKGNDGSEKKYQEAYLDPNQVILVLEEEKILGYLLYREEGDDADLDEIVIIPEERKRGLGEKLLSHFLTSLGENSTCFLEVRVSNLTAINLYQKCGFVYYRTRKNYYEGEDALCFKRGL